MTLFLIWGSSKFSFAEGRIDIARRTSSLRSTHTLFNLADEGDDGLLLVRFFDTEQLDPAQISATLEEFRQRVEALYVKGAVWNQGFTRIGREMYEEPLLIPAAASGVPDKVIQVPKTHTMQRLCQRMNCYAAMALHVTMAEFPDWELLQSTSVFQLSVNQATHRLHGEAEDKDANVNRRLSRIAQFVNEDPPRMQEQYRDMLPLAQWHRTNGTPGISNVECWRLAKQEFEGSRKASKIFAQNHPVNAIEKALAAYAAWQGCVTSGTETSHSITKRIRQGRETLDPAMMTMELKLLNDPPEDDAAS